MTAHLDLVYAEKLRRLRAAKNDKQEAVAMELGITQRDYSDLENGRSHFTDGLIAKICLTFKVQEAAFRRVELTPALSSFLEVLTEYGLVDAGRERVAKDLEILIYKKTIKELQYEKTKLLMEMNRSRTVPDKTEQASGIYVMI